MLFNQWKLLRSAKKGLFSLLDLAVEQVMTDYVVSTKPEKSVIDAAAMMVGEDVSALVVEQESRPIGILTERDFITKVPLSKEVLTMKVQNIMSCSFENVEKKKCAVEAVDPEALLVDARGVMKEHRIRKLVVLTKEGLTAGIITQTDLSKAIYEHIRVIPILQVASSVKDVMSSPIKSIEEDAKFSKAKEFMKKRKLSALPITKKKEFVGIFTEYDVVMQFYDEGKLQERPVTEIMKSPIKAIPAALNIFDANMIMLLEKIRRLIVIEDGKPIGIITQTDLVHACYEYAIKAKEYLSYGSEIREKDLLVLHGRGSIISEYAGEHLRAYTVKD